jgi:hypothetical protein
MLAQYDQMRDLKLEDQIQGLLDLFAQQIPAIARVLKNDVMPHPSVREVFTGEHGLKDELQAAFKLHPVYVADYIVPGFSHPIETIREVVGRLNSRKRAIQSVMRRQRSLLMDHVQVLMRKQKEVQVANALDAGPEELSHADLKNNIASPQADFNRISEWSEMPKGARNARKSMRGKQIEAKVRVNGMTFFLSTMHVTPEGRYECLMFALHEGILYPRVAYKSNSGLAWRINLVPGAWDYIKGDHYVQGSKPCFDLEQTLYTMESLLPNRPPIERKLDFIEDEETITHQNEIARKPRVPRGLEDVARHRPTYCIRQAELDESMFDAMPEAFMPDFTQAPIRIAHREGYMRNPMNRRYRYDQIRLELYEQEYDGEKYHFWMAYDSEGRVWVERIDRASSHITSYGTRQEVFEWAVCSKPFEYRSQSFTLPHISEEEAGRMQDHEGGFSQPVAIKIANEPNYSDITPFLDQFNIIKKFRKDRGINRKKIKDKWDPLPSLGLDPEPLEPEGLARLSLARDSNMPVTDELEGLLQVMNEDDPNLIEAQLVNILRNPGDRASITLRALRRILYRCLGRLENDAVLRLMDVILEQFHSGFPSEKAVYVAVFHDLINFVYMGGDPAEMARRAGGTQIFTVTMPDEENLRARRYVQKNPQHQPVPREALTDDQRTKYILHRSKLVVLRMTLVFGEENLNNY